VGRVDGRIIVYEYVYRFAVYEYRFAVYVYGLK
jgi:hypothetical protein